MGNYRLKTVATGRIFDDSGWVIDDVEHSSASLVRAEYEKKQIEIRAISEGIYRFSDWLPIRQKLRGSCAPITYKSEGLGEKLGLQNLYITFSGYFPEIGARMTTCSFKETEAYSVCGRIADGEQRVLVVASAGNTARAFARVCSQNNIKLLLCVPEDNLDALWFEESISDCVKLICCEKGGDYFDAIHLSNVVVKNDSFFAEGGAKNIARRDGMGTTMLSAAEVIGQIPSFYFQAVGSGTGAIAAWEANMRLIEDGRFGKNKSKLMLSQNAPFVPMADAWRANSRSLLEMDDQKARVDAGIIDAKVLSNRRPPYSIAGGLYDALSDAGGQIFCITNEQAKEAAVFFECEENIDIHPAAAVAVASLMEAAQKGVVKENDVVMINITGGGEKRFKKEHDCKYSIVPNVVFKLSATEDEILKVAKDLF